MFYIIDCFTGWLLEVGSIVVRVAYSCSSSHWNTMGVTTRPSQWQNKVGTYLNVLERCTLGVIQYRYTSLLAFS